MTTPLLTRMSLADFIDQSDYWCSTEEGLTEIRNMTDGHRALAARWLMTHATPIISVLECSYNESIIADERQHTISDILALMAQNPRTWMANTPLYRALVKGLPEAP